MASYPAKDTVLDGKAGFQTNVNMQRFLQKVGYYSKSRECDGVWGYWTTLALQQYMRTKIFPDGSRCYSGAVDGGFGSMTKRAMADCAQYFHGTRPGSTLHNSCSAWSCWVSWPNTEVVKDWQYFLNNNTP